MPIWIYSNQVTANSVYVWQISFDIQLQLQSGMWHSQNKKWMSIDIYFFY